MSREGRKATVFVEAIDPRTPRPAPPRHVPAFVAVGGGCEEVSHHDCLMKGRGVRIRVLWGVLGVRCTAYQVSSELNSQC